MTNRFNKEDFLKMRETQASLLNRKSTPMDHKVSEVMFQAASRAMEHVVSQRHDVCMQSVSLSTGLGKSTSAYAFIAAAARADSNFSAAYVVPTVKMAIEAQDGIEKLMGVHTTVLWSSYHKKKGVDRGRALNELGFLPIRTHDKSELQTSKIIIVTHSQLVRELKEEIDEGTLSYLGKPRSIVFIDEHPDLVEVVSCTAELVQSLHDRLAKVDNSHIWLPLFSEVAARMSRIVRSKGDQYIYAELVSPEEGALFTSCGDFRLWDLTDEESSEDVRRADVQAMTRVIDFCKASSKGNAFYSRKDCSFFTYQLYFPSSYAGFVLLDATSDLCGLVPLHSKVRTVDVPNVDYEPLDLFHIDLPARFSWIRDVIRMKALGQEYGKFIVETVLSNTSIGDEVLVVVHKDVLNQELIDTSEDPNSPLRWEGRLVNTQNWGAGVGLNKYKHKTHVFLFGDFYLPRSTAIGWTHGWAEKRLDNSGLKQAVSVRHFGERYSPRGAYKACHDGHILRWAKQLSMRGAARNVDESGKCFPMALYTTMDLGLLVPNLQRLFPNVRVPRPATRPKSFPGAQVTGRQALARLLTTSQKRSTYGADEVEAATGIPQHRLSREFEAGTEIYSALGWSVKPANELGLAGRMRYLVNETRIGREAVVNLAKSH